MVEVLEKLERQQLQLHFLEGSKFKTNLLGFLIRTPLTRETVTKTALLAELWNKGGGSYATPYAISVKMEELYGSVFDVSLLKKGEEQILFFYLEMPKLSELLLTEGLQFLRDVLESAKETKFFTEERLQRAKKSLSDKIRSLEDDKREYAKRRCLEEMFAETGFGIVADGYLEDMDDIDSAKLYHHCKKLMNEAPMELLFSGEEEQISQMKAIVRKMGNGKKIAVETWDHVPVKKRKQANEIWENKAVAQGRLAMTFTTGISPTDKKFPALMVANEILGGGSNSLLFQQVRERMGLCYYVNSFVYRMMGFVMVQAGIDPKEYENVVMAVQKTIVDLQEKGIGDKQLREAKDGLLRFYTSLKDSQVAKMDFYLDEYLLGTEYTPKRTAKKIERVTKEDIMQVISGFTMDTVYFLAGEEEKNG